MEKLKNNKFYNMLELILELILGLLVILQSVKKGGFYISDMKYIFFAILIVTVIFAVKKIIDKRVNINLGTILLMFLFIFYTLPIIFKKCADFDSAIWESLKYLELFCVYFVVTNSSNKRIYEIVLLVLGIVIGIFGIDQIACRYFIPFLNALNSGYLSTYLERLSSTIQYANTAGIILMVAFLVGKKMLFEYLTILQNEYNMKNITKTKYLYIALSFLFLCILFTQSRGIIIITIIACICIDVFNRKDKNVYMHVLMDILIIILSIITSSFAGSYIYGEVIYIYLITVIFAVISSLIFSILLNKVIMNIKVWYKLENLNKGKILKISIVTISVISIYLVLAFNLTTKVTLSYNTKDIEYVRKINVDSSNNNNEIGIEIKENIEDADYTIDIYEQLSSRNEFLICRLTKKDLINGYINKSLNVSKDAQKIIVKTKIERGSIDILKLKYQEKDVKLNYLLLSSDIIERFSEDLFNSTGTIVRIEYIKDAMKIFKTSPIIGRGGEAFRYLYKEFQTGNYISTEVHSSFIQVLIESGILGFLVISTFVIYILLKGKKSEYKLIFLAFVIHSMFELNFSYAISVIILGLLSGILQNSESYDIKNENLDIKK